MSVLAGIKKFIRDNDKIHLKVLQEQFSLSEDQVTEIICAEWVNFNNPQFVHNYVDKDFNIEWYVEYCEGRHNRANLHPAHLKCDHTKSDVHHSVFFKEKSLAMLMNKSNTVRVGQKDSLMYAPYIIIEMDRPSVEDSANEAARILKDIPKGTYRVFYSGNRGHHIYVSSELFGSPVVKATIGSGRKKFFYNLAGLITKDSRHGNGIVYPHDLNNHEALKLYYNMTGQIKNVREAQHIKQWLENFDPNIYSFNSLIRSPNSIHEKTGKRKVDVTDFITDISKYESAPIRDIELSPQNIPPIYIMKNYTALLSCDYVKTKPIGKKYSKNVYVHIFKEYIKEFDIHTANSLGWINKLYSPFYDDTKPSVGVNIETGQYHDFGTGEHLTFEEFVTNLVGNRGKALIKIHQLEKELK